MCIFSKFPISDAIVHQFPINGDFYALYFGDWLAGYGLCCSYIDHPQAPIIFFAVHVSINIHTNIHTRISYHSHKASRMHLSKDQSILMSDHPLPSLPLQLSWFILLVSSYIAIFSCLNSCLFLICLPFYFPVLFHAF